MSTALPAASAFTGASVTEGAFKTAITDLRTFLDERIGAAAGSGPGVFTTLTASTSAYIGATTSYGPASQSLQSVGAGSNYGGGLGLVQFGGANNTYHSILDFCKSRGSSNGSYTVVAADDVLGRIRAYGADGTDFADAAEITFEVDGTPGANDMPGRIIFKTSADGTESPREVGRFSKTGGLQATLVPRTNLTYSGGDTTPSVANTGFMSITNGGATTITNFDDGEEGQIIVLFFNDANTTVDRSNAYLAGGANFVSSANDILVLRKTGASWIEVCRSVNS